MPSEKRFTAKQRALLALVPPVAAGLLKSIAASCRHEAQNEEAYRAACAKGRVIFPVWHETSVLAGLHYGGTGIHTLTSLSFDGEMAAATLAWWGLPSVRGSSSRGGAIALEGLEEVLRAHGSVGWTVDGPRGPRRIAKPGVAVLAARTGASLLPHAFAALPCWRLNSWDRFIVPKPFGKIVVRFGTPIPPPASEAPEAIEAVRREIDAQLNALHAAIDE